MMKHKPVDATFLRACVKLSEVLDCMKVSCPFFSSADLHSCRFKFSLANRSDIVRLCVCVQKNTTSVAENDASTLGLGLDLDARYQEAEKVGHPGS